LGKRLAQVGQGWTVGEQILLPGDVFLESVGESLFHSRTVSYAFGPIIIAVASHGKKNHQVPMVPLAMAHPQGSFLSAVLQGSGARLVQIDEIKQLARRGLHQSNFIEVGSVRSGQTAATQGQ